jgi:pyruvate carboxylase
MKTFDQVLQELSGKPVLVANRGISARRICRSIRERFDAVAVMAATDVDKTAPSASAAQELLLLGPDPRAYLDIDRIITLARRRGVVGIHPGWGFASEDARFPRKCADAGLVFIGASAEAMNLLGNKVQLRNLAKSMNIPTVPGSEGAVDPAEARALAESIGLPIMLKAEGGGGGRGIFPVRAKSEIDDAFFKASAMAQASFGNPRIFVEKYLESVRHIEIQVVADKYGNVFAFDERDCTIQRNHQKLIEITPSPWTGVTPLLREELKEYARRLVLAVGYHSLVTVEFLIDGDGTPYLIEANTRLQVEHGITECRYGVDLVEEQIAVAFGARLRLNETDNLPMHCAMQVRINCEDPRDNFAPNSGLVTRYVSPGGPGVRLDSNMSAGYEFPPNYDSAGALLITYATDWKKTIGIMERALSEYVVGGIKTTIPFFRQVIRHPRFREGSFDTDFIADTPELMGYSDLAPEGERLARLAAEISAKGYNPHVRLGEYRSADTPRLGAFEPVLPPIGREARAAPSPYPRGDRKALLDYVRDAGYVHFTDTTPRDFTQSNNGNRFRLAEDALIGPYMDNAGYFSIENGGGAHFHMAMLTNMTYPFSEAGEWNRFAPKTLKQILVRSTNVLGYSPQPRNLMRLTGEMVCEHYHVIRCFDFLNHAENMLPFAEVITARGDVVFEPAISLSPAEGFDTAHYLDAAEALLRMTARAAGTSVDAAARRIILGLKDMAGVCPPRFISGLVSALRKQRPELVLHYHRHYTDGLFTPSVAAAAKAGAHIVDVGLGAGVRSYGQGDVLATAAYMEGELGLRTNLNKEAIRDANFVLKQIMPYYDRYCSPYFLGIDHDVVEHGMPGGATSSSQEGAFKQGYIHLLPYMLKFLAATRKVVRYHDVTPGSQITWNTAFLAVTGAWKRGGEPEVRYLLQVLNEVSGRSEEDLSGEMRKARLGIYRDCNDAFRNLLLGKFGRLPLGFPPDWVYRSAFGNAWKQALAERSEASPLEKLEDVDPEAEERAFRAIMKRGPTPEEFVLYLNHPGDALKTINFRAEFGDPNNLPLHVWFEGMRVGEEVHFTDSKGKPHHLTMLGISLPNAAGVKICRYVLDSEIMSCDVQVLAPQQVERKDAVIADPDNPFHVAAPTNGDLWIMYVHPGDIVKKGEELFNISIMKQEKAVTAPVDGMVVRVLKSADYKETRQMVSVRENELIVELGPVPRVCSNEACARPITLEGIAFCPYCGEELHA